MFCVGKDSAREYAVIGGAAKQGGQTNAAGSALAAVVTFAPTSTKRATVVVGPGRWDEAIVVPAWTTVHILPGAQLWPIVTAASDINGGVIRIAPDGNAPKFSVQGVEIIVDGLVQNDAHPYGNASIDQDREYAILVGTDVSPFPADPSWNNIRISGRGQIVSNDVGIAWAGESSVAPSESPGMTIDGPTIVGGAFALARSHLASVEVANARLIVNPTWCEDPNTQLTNQIGPTSVDAGVGSTTTFRMSTAHSFVGTDKIVNRKVTFAGGGACGANGQKSWIDDYQSSTRVATIEPAVSATLNDADCTYTIAKVPNALLAPCTDTDWTPLRAAQVVHFGYGTKACLHTFSSTASSTGALEGVQFTNSTCEAIIRDGGPRTGTTLGCEGGRHLLGGIVESAGDNDVERVTGLNLPITLRIESDLPTIGSNCSFPVNGIFIGGGQALNKLDYSGWIRILNSGDTDVNMLGFSDRSLEGANNTYRFHNLRIDIERPAGYTGTFAHLDDFASIAGSIITGDVITGDSDFKVSVYGGTYASSIKGGFGSSSRACVTASVTSNQGAWNPGANENICVTALGGANRTIAGIAGGWEGRYMRIINADPNGNTITIDDGDTLGLAIQRDEIETHTGADIILGKDASLLLWYGQLVPATPGPWRSFD